MICLQTLFKQKLRLNVSNKLFTVNYLLSNNTDSLFPVVTTLNVAPFVPLSFLLQRDKIDGCIRGMVDSLMNNY